MRTFTLIWFGQFVSLLGTGMTRFALLIWAYQQTGEATTLALLGFFSYVPYILLSPVAGIWVDRLDRRTIMIVADLGAGLMTLIIFGLMWSGGLAIWHLYLLQFTASVFETFQMPAYTAATTTLLEPKDYSRASGMRSLSEDASQIGAPLAAGTLLALIGIEGILVIDVITFLIAVGTLALVRIPSAAADPDAEPDESFWQQTTFGFRYIFARPGLRTLALLYVGINFFAALTYFSILPALILARTGGDEVALGVVQAALGGAGVVGGLVVSFIGLPGRKIHYILAGAGLSFLGGDLLFAVGRSLPVWIGAAAIASFFIPFIMAANRTIWQMKVPAILQGRVLSTYGVLRNVLSPVGYLVAGPLADHVFGPAMAPDGWMTPIFGSLLGTGPGAGIAFMFFCTAILGAAMSFGGYLFPSVRNVEDKETLVVQHIGEQEKYSVHDTPI